MNLYFWLNFIVIIGPLALSFDKKVAFWRRWVPLALSMLIVSGFFIVWDIFVTIRGDWSFSPEFAGTFKILALPPGEWMFFFSVPYACIFIYECVRAYFKDAEWKAAWWIMLVVGIIGLVPALLFWNREYTLLNGIVFTVSIVMICFLNKKMYQSRTAIVSLLLTYIPFLVVNMVFTSLPIVLYNPDAIIGIRVSLDPSSGLGIPIEDFFYSFSLINLFLFFYLLFRKYSIGEKKKDE